MNLEESENREITWTVAVQGTAAQAKDIEQLIQQFTSQVQAVGAKSNFVQVMQIKATAVQPDRIEHFVNMMRQQGVPEEQIERQKLLFMAQMGQGSWADVVSAAERELAIQRMKGDIPQELGLVFQLVEYAMNGGDKEKAINYFQQAERLMTATPLADLMGERAVQMPLEAQEQTRQHYQRQLERLRNWLF